MSSLLYNGLFKIRAVEQKPGKRFRFVFIPQFQSGVLQISPGFEDKPWFLLRRKITQRLSLEELDSATDPGYIKRFIN